MAPAASNGSDPRWPRAVYLVSHTHWDREWYRPFEDFRADLVTVIDRVLELLEGDEAFEHFVLDGQSILVEDYLEIRPGDRGRLERAARTGQLSLGPWYVLSDEFLVSGEATVRNLLRGHRVAASLGPVSTVGYLPDAFGHIAQMPQLLNRVGIRHFVYTRGDDDEIDRTGSQYRWQGPDGSEVMAFQLYRGYCAGGALGFSHERDVFSDAEPDPELAVEQVRQLLAEMEPLARSDVAIIPNGCDHLPPQRNLGPIIGALREAFPGTEFHHTGYHEALNAMSASSETCELRRGELRGGSRQLLLPGVLSSRVYLKQANGHSELLLVGMAEPLTCYLRGTAGGVTEPGLLDRAWRLLLQNHPHDSICGCSTDAVHREMEARFSSVQQLGEQVLRQGMSRLSPVPATSDTDVVLTVFNPLPYRRTALVERLVVLPGNERGTAGWELVDEAGDPVPYRVVRQYLVESHWGHDYRRDPLSHRAIELFDEVRTELEHRLVRPAGAGSDCDRMMVLQFPAELPALAHASFRLRPSSGDTVLPPRPVTVSGPTVENALVRVTLAGDGTFALEHKESGRTYSGLNLLESTEDIGDEYDYSPAPSTMTLDCSGIAGAVSLVSESPWKATLEAKFSWPLPVGVTRQRRGRRIEMVECPVRVRVTVSAASPVVDIVTEFDNQARDHRLRALFPTGSDSDTLVSEGQFHVASRPVEPPDRPRWTQPPSGTQPQQGWSAVESAGLGLALFNRGLPEISARRREDGTTVALTLLRAVGWLSRDDHSARRGAVAGPMVPTPDAQCLGPNGYRYAVMPYSGDWRSAAVARHQEQWRVPTVAIQGAEALPGRGDFLALEGDDLMVSSVKPQSDGPGIVVRLWNASPEERRGLLRLSAPLTGAWHTDLLERRTEAIVPEGNSVTVVLEPWEIATVELVPSP